MANLIITIIAIALVAVMAIAGAWYGSSAFQEAQLKAQANTIASHMSQIAKAWQAWAVMNGGYTQFETANNVTLFQDNLVPTYLESVPVIPASWSDTTTSANNAVYLARCMILFNTSSCSPKDMVRIYVSNYSRCAAISSMVGGTTHTPSRVIGTGSGPQDIRAVGLRPMDCVWWDQNSDNVQDSPPTDRYVVFYQAL